MNKCLSVAWLGILLATTAGCSDKYAQEISTRLEVAENNAAMARVRADEAYTRALLAAEVAHKAQQTADEANRRTANKATRK